MNEIQVTGPVGLTSRLAEFASGFTIEAAPKTVVQNAKLAILDCLGVSVLALSQEVGQATLLFARDNVSPGPCTVWGSGVGANARDAAFCNGVLSHGLDFDDRNHSSTFTLAAALAAAEQDELSGARLLGAFIAGREVRNSLDKLFSDRNSGIGPGAKGWHSNGVLGSIAAACSAGNALGLDPAQMVDCVGLAAGSCGALTRDGGTMAKPFRTGHSAATGLSCAFLARSGFSADHAALEGRFGLLDALSPLPDAALSALGEGLGFKFQLEAGIKSKPYASCTATHSAVEAMLRLVSRNVVDPQAVESIECDLKPYPLVRQHPVRGVEGRFSMPFCLAVAVAHRRLQEDDFTDERVSEPEIQALMQRTRHMSGATTLLVRLRNGECLSEDLRPPSNYTSVEEIDSKFRRCAGVALTSANASRAAALVHDLERLGSVRELTQLLRTDTR